MLENSSVFLIDDSLSTTLDLTKNDDFISGKNNKNVLVLVKVEAGAALNPKDKELLLKIAGSLNLNHDDLLIINTAHIADISFHSILTAGEFRKAIVFGVSEQTLKLNINYRLNRAYIFNGIKMIFTTSLGQLQVDQNAKRELWIALKDLFSACKKTH